MSLLSNHTLEYKISKVAIDLSFGTIVLKFDEGYQDGETFVILSTKEVPISTTDSAVIFAKLGDSTKSLYASVKETLYQYLIDAGIVAGTIV